MRISARSACDAGFRSAPRLRRGSRRGLTVATRARNVVRVHHRAWISLIACLLAGWAVPGAAQSPVVQAQGPVRYVSGGIGVDERLALAAMQSSTYT